MAQLVEAEPFCPCHMSQAETAHHLQHGQKVFVDLKWTGAAKFQAPVMTISMSFHQSQATQCMVGLLPSQGQYEAVTFKLCGVAMITRAAAGTVLQG